MTILLILFHPPTVGLLQQMSVCRKKVDWEEREREREVERERERESERDGGSD